MPARERDALGIRQIDEVRRILSRPPPVIVTADIPFTTQNEQVKALVMRTVARDYERRSHARIHARTISVWVLRDAPAEAD